MTELGLLHLLWESGELNHWQGRSASKRGWRDVATRLRSRAAFIEVGKQRPLSGHLALIQPEGNKTIREELHRSLQHLLRDATRRGRRILIVSELHSVGRSDDGRVRLRLHGEQNWLEVWASEFVVSEMERRFKAELTSIGRASRSTERLHCMCIGVAEPRERISSGADVAWDAEVIKIALMTANRRFIPYASSYELRVADLLIDQHRDFRKPLRYDFEMEATLPDFELLDAGHGAMPMEVFGRTDDDYVKRANEKRKHYDEVYGSEGWWSWDAAKDPQKPPDLPAPA